MASTSKRVEPSQTIKMEKMMVETAYSEPNLPSFDIVTNEAKNSPSPVKEIRSSKWMNTERSV